MPCPFTGPKNFCDGPNFLGKTKNLIAFIASSKTFIKNFCAGTKIEFTQWKSSFGVAQNVSDQYYMYLWLDKFFCSLPKIDLYIVLVLKFVHLKLSYL